MLKPLTLVALLFFSFIVNAEDTLINAKKFLDLDVFKNEKEKQLFTSIAAGKEIDFLTLFHISDSSLFASHPPEQLNSRLKDFFSTAGYGRKHDFKSKDLKKIYKDIHDAFLTRYVDNPSFGQMFIDGDYNCATATALYALILDELGINYSIRQTPVHVYIVAEPETLNMLFETTAPGSKPLEITDKSKVQYISYLYKNKLISKDEYSNGDKNKLFEKHFYSDELIDKKKLGALLYYNRGVAAMTAENYREAYKYFEKSAFLYPDKKMTYLVSTCLGNILMEKGMMENEEAYPYFLRFTEIAKGDTDKEAIQEYMDKVSQKLLFKSPDLKKYRTLYTTVIGKLTDTAILWKLNYSHYYNTAHYYSIKNKHDSSLVYLDSVYAYNKSDLLIHELITSSIEEKIRGMLVEDVALTALEKYFETYSFIDKNSKLGEYYSYCLSKVLSKHFQKDRKKEGDTYLETMKDMLKKYPELAMKVQPYVVPAFLEVYYHYLRKMQYKEAKAFLLSVKPFYPEDEELKIRMERIDSILQGQKNSPNAKIVG